MLRLIAPSLLLLSLAACATGTSPPDDDPITPIDTPPDSDDTDSGPTGAPDNSPDPTQFDEYLDEADLIADDFGWFSDPFRTRLATLPTTGSSSYDGVLEVALPQEDGTLRTLGDLNLTVFFDGSPGSGDVEQLIDEANQTYVGTLAIGGVLVNTSDINAPSLAGDISGTLTDEALVDHVIDGQISADFYTGTEYIAGDVVTTVTTAGSATQTEGEFIAIAEQ